MNNFDLQQYLTDLRTLCAIDSGQGNAAGTKAVTDFFAQRYAALGLQTERRFLNGNSHAPVLLVRNSDDEEIDVLFIAHMDTVFAPGTAEKWPFSVDENGIGHGPGCADCKSGCLSIYYLLRAMLENGDCRFRFCVIMNSDEEKGSYLSRPYFEELAPRAKCCLVFEPGRPNDEFVGCRKAGYSYRVRCHGVRAHAAVEPEKGASALLELARWVNELYTLTDYAAGTTVNVGSFSGGTDDGSVPYYAECTFSIRFIKEEAEERLQTMLRRMKEEPFDPRTSIEVTEVSSCPAIRPHEKTEALFALLRETGSELGQPVELLTTGGRSDGNWVSHYGVATLDGCGPCGGNLHTEREYLKTMTVEPRLDMMRTLLNKLFPAQD